MDRDELLAFYASYYDALAGPSNLSPEVCYSLYRTRSYFRSILRHHYAGQSSIAVCNVGIGQGDWDLFLSFELGGRGNLTSIEVRQESCDTLTARMEIQGHPYEIVVVNEDVNETSVPPRSFDLLTVIGSTVKESGAYTGTLRSCTRLLRTGGLLLYSDFPKYHDLETFRALADSIPLTILEAAEETNPGLPFYLVLAERVQG